MIFAAIDIGSNAVRLLFGHVHEQKGKAIFKKGELIRLPIRLGDDSFTKQEISQEKADKLVTAMKGFAELIKVFDVKGFKACATSAMRDAKNGDEIIKRIKRESGLDVEIIDGKTEAATIFSNRRWHFAYLIALSQGPVRVRCTLASLPLDFGDHVRPLLIIRTILD